MAKLEMVKNKYFLPLPSGNVDILTLIKTNIQTLPKGIQMTKKNPIFITFANSSFYYLKFGHKEKNNLGSNWRLVEIIKHLKLSKYFHSDQKAYVLM